VTAFIAVTVSRLAPKQRGAVTVQLIKTMTEKTKEQLEHELEETRAERNRYHSQLTDLMLSSLRNDVNDHESRIRSLETVATRSNVLFALATGGGLISIVTLIRTFV
jgi:phosphomevalonate kinase